ncbi:SusD/RagB family nutrient-binding outer membrane lipoprotein [Catalinimonas niigatensis]|uniref:SusD/RagB family nutrient-binding outer membrane lipoprotein n=1 Tax=Catalinimonas niigatensis TaxID=1397264 RepID=UPI002665F3D7|nr:SusD/RagB family nutrient-binding outer membrane lipoprotein [Catalinimonas niigatensis]WPP53244.1 SusD/RagB family nutrient-binding outer membrane lipoprotein [Catalinimonas niigatensis]
MNRIMRKLNILYLAVLLMVFVSCEDYLDINDDPNNPTVTPLSGLMATATIETANNVYDAAGITSYYVQYLSSPNAASATDIHDEVSYNGTWSNLYSVMTDLSDMELLAEETGATEYLGVAKILMALNLGMTVDLWGNVPYEEAFFAETLTPSYNDAEALYEEVFTLLDEGIAALQQDNSTVVIGGDDFFFGGDTEAWIKTASALRARYLLHMSETSAYDPQAVLAAVDNGFTSSEDDAQVISFAAVPQRNPWSQVAINNADLLLGGWISEQLVQAMDGTTYGYVDPRMSYMYGQTDAGEFVGTPNGAGRGDAPEQGARSTLVTDTYYAAETAPLLVITYFEQKFIEAEAALDANNSSRAYDAYLEGIRAHMEKLGIESAEIDAYLVNPEVSVGAADLTQQDIFKEKYIAMYLHPEAWADARRYDYQYEGMTLPANHNPSLNGQFIRRLAYPDSENTRNGSNVPDVSLGDPLWWDE